MHVYQSSPNQVKWAKFSPYVSWSRPRLTPKRNLKSPCFFLQVAPFLQIICVLIMVKLIDKAIVINIKIHKNERKRLCSSNKENLTCYIQQKYHSKFLNLYCRNSRWKLNPKSKNSQQTLPIPNVLLECVIFLLLF